MFYQAIQIGFGCFYITCLSEETPRFSRMFPRLLKVWGSDGSEYKGQCFCSTLFLLGVRLVRELRVLVVCALDLFSILSLCKLVLLNEIFTRGQQKKRPQSSQQKEPSLIW